MIITNEKVDMEVGYSSRWIIQAKLESMIHFEELKKILPDEIEEFEKLSETITNHCLKFFPNQSFSIEDVIHYCVVGDEEKTRIRYFLYGDDEYTEREDNLSEIKMELIEARYLFKWILVKFKQKTNMNIFPKVKKGSYNVMFCMDLSDVFVLSPSAQLLKDNGVEFETKKWVESEYIQGDY